MADTTRSSAASQFEVKDEGGVWLVTPVVDLASMNWCELPATARDVLGDAAGATRPQVVFDLAGHAYFGSYFLGILVRCWKHISSHDGGLALSGVSEIGREVLEITALDTLWEVYPTRADAIEAMAHR
jgi:anti-anti-sigma factor